MNLDDTFFEHLFVVSLQKIKMDLDNKPIECRIKYKYSLFSNEEVSTAAFIIDGNNEPQEIPPQSGFNEYILSSKITDSDIKEFLGNNLIELNVFDQELKIGSGSVNLTEIYSDSAQKWKQNSFLKEVSLLASKYTPIEKVLGSIECLFVLVPHECIQCKCEKIYRMSGIQKHINQSACKSQYSIEEIESLKQHAITIRKKNQKAREFHKYDPVKRTEKHKKAYNAKKQKESYDMSKLETNKEVELDPVKKASKQKEEEEKEKARKEANALNSAKEKESKVREINKSLFQQTNMYFENGCRKLKNGDQSRLSREILQQLKKLENDICDLHKKLELEIDALDEEARKKARFPSFGENYRTIHFHSKLIKSVNDVYKEFCHGKDDAGVSNLGKLCLEWHALQLTNDHALQKIGIYGFVDPTYACYEEHFCIHCETSYSNHCSGSDNYRSNSYYNSTISHIPSKVFSTQYLKKMSSI